MMEEKLEKLAESRRRLTSPYPTKEFGDKDFLFKKFYSYNREDRNAGDFPYDDDSVLRMRDFFAGKDILITGGTGFVGKVLIEKILRSLPEGGRIYLLVRGRKGLSPQQRIQAMLKLPLFEHVLTENPKAAERLVTIEGDCASLGLGLSQDNRRTIIENVSIVFHCAATVNFILPLTLVVLVNTRGTREIVELCKALKKLDVFVYISTAYSSATTDRTTPIPEEVLDAGVNWRTMIALAEKSSTSLKRDGFDLIFEKLETKHPNNYTFSKLLAENLVEEECKDLPAIIVRPSVLMPTYEDPFGGWVDNLYGPLSLVDSVGRGVIRVVYGKGDISLDYLPVDANIKTTIVGAWHRGLGFRLRRDRNKVDVINNCTGSFDKSTFEVQKRITNFVFSQSTHKYILRSARWHVTNNYWIFWLITITSHLSFGIFVDTLLRLVGRKPLLVQAYRRIFFAQSSVLHYFAGREFLFEDRSQWLLGARVPEEDKPRFSWATSYFPMAYSVDGVAGVIRYVFNETPVKADQSNRKIVLVFEWIQTVLLAVFGLWIFWIILR